MTDLTAWLGDAATDLTPDQYERLTDANRIIEARYPIPTDGEYADVAEDRDTALVAAMQVILGETSVEQLAEDYATAQRRALVAHAAQTGGIIAAVQTLPKVEVARLTGLSRPTIDKALAS